MATITRTPKKILQSALSTTATFYYTPPANGNTQITEIWISNTGTNTRLVTLYAHGLTTNNTISTISLTSGGSALISNAKIILLANEVFGAKQDVGTDIVVTAYGIEEITV